LEVLWIEHGDRERDGIVLDLWIGVGSTQGEFNPHMKYTMFDYLAKFGSSKLKKIISVLRISLHLN